MNADYFRSLYQYHVTMYDQLWESIAQLTEAQFVQESGYSIGSVRNHMVHVMNVDQRWFQRINGVPISDRLVFADFTTPAATQERWNRIEQGCAACVAALDDADFDRMVTYDLPQRGGMKQNTVWEIVAHVVNHGTDHRSQVLALLHSLGTPTFEHDFIIYLWSR